MYLFRGRGSKGAHVAREPGVQRATAMMRRHNHYGWFEKIETGVYGLTHRCRRRFSCRPWLLGAD